MVKGEVNATSNRGVHQLAKLIAAAEEKTPSENGAAERLCRREIAVMPLESGVFASNDTSDARRSRKASNAVTCFSP